MRQFALGIFLHLAVPASVGLGLSAYAAYRIGRRNARELVQRSPTHL